MSHDGDASASVVAVPVPPLNENDELPVVRFTTSVFIWHIAFFDAPSVQYPVMLSATRSQNAFAVYMSCLTEYDASSSAILSEQPHADFHLASAPRAEG